jgi:hypothetical protein
MLKFSGQRGIQTASFHNHREILILNLNISTLHLVLINNNVLPPKYGSYCLAAINHTIITQRTDPVTVAFACIVLVILTIPPASPLPFLYL